MTLSYTSSSRPASRPNRLGCVLGLCLSLGFACGEHATHDDESGDAGDEPDAAATDAGSGRPPQEDAADVDDATVDAAMVEVDSAVGHEVAPRLPAIAYTSFDANIGPLATVAEVRITPSADGNRLTVKRPPDCENGAPAECDEIPARLLSFEETTRVAERLEAFPEPACWTVSPLITAAPKWALDIDEETFLHGGDVVETCEGHFAATTRLAGLLVRLAFADYAPEPSNGCFSPTENPLDAYPDGAEGCPCDWPGQAVCVEGAALVCGEFWRETTPHTRWITVIDGPCWPFGCEDDETKPDLQSCMDVREHCYQRRPDTTYCSRDRYYPVADEDGGG